jgi:hypothetical protein
LSQKDPETARTGYEVEMASVTHNNENAEMDSHTPDVLASGSSDGISSRPAGPKGTDTPGTERSQSPSHFAFTNQSATSAVSMDVTNRSRDNAEGASRDGAIASQIRLEHDDVVPASIGRDTCPICIVDFEEGDDIRVLPCEGKHCFHQACVDPWLLKLSSSCPICRHGIYSSFIFFPHYLLTSFFFPDFLALENMLSGNSDDEIDNENPESDHRASHLRGHGVPGRFSRYLRFAHHRERRRRGDEVDPTDPYMSRAPVTSVYAGI